jgi:hypothetical protein
VKKSNPHSAPPLPVQGVVGDNIDGCIMYTIIQSVITTRTLAILLFAIL